MRITREEQKIIVDSVHCFIEKQAKIWLFGSRCDDNAKGGDIDLYIESKEIESPLLQRIKLKLALEDKLGIQKIDLLYHNKKLPLQPIHKIAKTEGVLLN